jgi:hypothetical protein
LWIKDFQEKSDGRVRNRLNINSLTDSFRILFQLDAYSFGRVRENKRYGDGLGADACDAGNSWGGQLFELVAENI